MGNVNAKESRSRSQSEAGGSSGPATLSGAAKRRLRSNTTPAGMGLVSRKPKKHVKSQQELDAEEIASLVFDPEEVVDGGYLVPHGIYTGAQTYKYKIVRQLILERRLAPFYKPLADFDESWTDRQVLAALRGLTHPDQAEEKGEDKGEDKAGSAEMSESATGGFEKSDLSKSAGDLGKCVGDIEVPLGDFATPCGDIKGKSVAQGIAEQNGPENGAEEAVGSPVARSVSDGSSTTDSSTMPTSSSDTPDASDSKLVQNGFSESEEETELPRDEEDESLDEVYALKQQTEHVECAPLSKPSVTRNRSNTSPRYRTAEAQNTDAAIEVQVYRGATECPICFLFFPKYLNHTRCCGQPICTECFVQIKRAEPHPPYQNPDAASSSASSSTAGTEPAPEQLVSDPACCPYCAAPDFGVVYFPSKFRYGLFPKNGTLASLNQLLKNGDSKAGSPRLEEPKFDYPDRKGSIPPSAAEVVTTDQIRPDWLVVLNAARQHQARRSAAATALHATAFLMQQDSSSSVASSAASQRKPRKPRRFRGLSSRREEQQGLEDLMLLEAIRLSLNDEESRRQKEYKGKGKEPAST